LLVLISETYVYGLAALNIRSCSGVDQPFYTVLPDHYDCMARFNGTKLRKYVAQENLVADVPSAERRVVHDHIQHYFDGGYDAQVNKQQKNVVTVVAAVEVYLSARVVVILNKRMCMCEPSSVKNQT
jgi:Hemimethylated DNA-binding protein YccV like